MAETIIELYDGDKARVIVAALRAHGFHPVEGGVPGFPGVQSAGGIPIAVPEEEAFDARILAKALLADMTGGAKKPPQ